MAPCCYDWDATAQLGNAFRDDFAGLWHGEAYTEFRRRATHDKRSLELCRTCEGGDVSAERKQATPEQVAQAFSRINDLGASNGWAIGSALSEGGRGMLIANPHYPWVGSSRFWEKLGVTYDEVAFAPNAFLFSSLHDFTPEQWELLQGPGVYVAVEPRLRLMKQLAGGSKRLRVRRTAAVLHCGY